MSLHTTTWSMKREHQAISPKITRTTTDAFSNGFKRLRVSEQDASKAVPPILASRIVPVSHAEEASGPGEYTQRQNFPSTPTPTQAPLLSLHHPSYGLPAQLLHNFDGMGIKSIYPWQCSCLLSRGVLQGSQNLVYTAPTGGGKSLVADLLMIKRALEGKKAMLVLPYVALVQEKTRWLRAACQDVQKSDEVVNLSTQGLLRPREHRSLRVVGFFGASKTREDWDDVDIAVCTIEKANMMINKAVTTGCISDLGIVAVDEMHMINDEHRGYILELVVTKLLTLDQSIQIVGMSATLSNAEDLARWLNAKCVQSTYRPIPIEEFLVVDNIIYPLATSLASAAKSDERVEDVPKSSFLDKTEPPVRTIEKSDHPALRGSVVNAVVALAIETASSGYGALVFSNSRAGVQNLALLLADAMPPVPGLASEVVKARQDVQDNLRTVPNLQMDDVLERSVMLGVGYHHAGLTAEERDIIAQAFDQGTIKILVATCTLAAGINLPARRVILHGVRVGREMVGPAMMRQMRGRAGRKGKDELGEAYVCCDTKELEEVRTLVETELPPVESGLIPEKQGLKRALLEAIAINLATHPNSIQTFVQRTLLFSMVEKAELNSMIKEGLSSLETDKLVTISELEESYKPTLLGQAIAEAGFSPEDGLFIHEEIQRALKSLVLDGELHIFYLFTPIRVSGQIAWDVFRDEVSSLSESDLRVLLLCGLKPAVINRQAMSTTPLSERDTRLYTRFYTALQLQALCTEMPLHKVAQKYKLNKGDIQTLSQSSVFFAASMVTFCKRMGWDMLAAVLTHAQDRLVAGARADLLELARIPGVKSRTARVLWENGFKSVRSVSEAEIAHLADVLVLAQPKRRKWGGEEGRRWEEKVKIRASEVQGAAARLWLRMCDEEAIIDED